MRALKCLAFAGLLGAAVSVQAAPVTYQLDPSHTMVLFSWNHFGYSNPTADLGLGEGTVVFDEQHPANSSVEVTLPLARLDTHVAALDEHLKKPDFLDADKYPVVTFKSTAVQPLGVNRAEQPLTIVASRSHGHAALAELCAALEVAEDVSVGSSLKFCLLARGAAQLYPRFTPTSEWDTAAGQAVLQAAGGVVLDLDGLPLTCGHPEQKFLNTWFVAASSRDLALAALAHMVRFAET